VESTETTTPPSQQSFTVETTSSVKRTGQRVSIALKEDGTIDWDSMRDKTSASVRAAIRNDPTARTMLTGMPEAARIVQPAHVVTLLNIVEFVERLTLPKIVEAKTKGEVKVNPEAADKAFRYTDAEKKSISEPAAIVLDDHLPLTIKLWFAKGGPISDTLTALFEAEHRKLMTYVVMCQLKAGKVPVNGSGSTTAEPTPEEKGILQ
jgi:hypothetical protein